jgi:hypothetical protein
MEEMIEEAIGSYTGILLIMGCVFFIIRDYGMKLVDKVGNFLWTLHSYWMGHYGLVV